MRNSSLCLLSCGAVLLVLASTPVRAGWIYDMDEPLDSPAWWTLTDDITPEQLKATLGDREACLRRYQAAFEAGLERAFSDDELDTLSFYYHRQQNPELMPMGHAFSSWAGGYRFHPEHSGYTEEMVAKELREYGISEAGIGQLIVYAAKYRQEKAALVDEIMHDQQEFVAIQRKFLYPGREDPDLVLSPDKGRKAKLDSALARKDYAFFARLSGESEERIKELMAAWRTDPGDRAASKNLPLMKVELSSEDWAAFRRYLLKEKASKMGSLADFSAALGAEE